MHGLSFSLNHELLEKYYQGNYNEAYNEIKKIIEKDERFKWIHETFYRCHYGSNQLVEIYKIILTLSSIVWFKESVKNIIIFKIEDWSDCTDVIKN